MTVEPGDAVRLAIDWVCIGDDSKMSPRPAGTVLCIIAVLPLDSERIVISALDLAGAHLRLRLPLRSLSVLLERP